ncbi:MAG TPA: hypothetical protein VG326_20030 [Tepidisphaeraceae bacterium]|jgi:hypothetical protein|nr:hypothetical protein [Tepidisphaeraceae bacterium]
MKYAIALVTSLALLSFIGSASAADAKAPKPHPGHFISFDGKELIVKGGAKGTGKEHKIKVDDKTKYTIDGKDVTAEEAQKALKADEYVEVTAVDHVATLVAAQTTAPAAPAGEKKPDAPAAK